MPLLKTFGTIPVSWFYKSGRATGLGKSFSRFWSWWASFGLPPYVSGCPRSGKIGHAEGGVLEGVGVAVYEKDDLLGCGLCRKFLARGRMECRVPQADDISAAAPRSLRMSVVATRWMSTPYATEPFCANLFRDRRFVSLEERERQSSPN